MLRKLKFMLLLFVSFILQTVKSYEKPYLLGSFVAPDHAARRLLVSERERIVFVDFKWDSSGTGCDYQKIFKTSSKNWAR